MNSHKQLILNWADAQIIEQCLRETEHEKSEGIASDVYIRQKHILRMTHRGWMRKRNVALPTTMRDLWFLRDRVDPSKQIKVESKWYTGWHLLEKIYNLIDSWEVEELLRDTGIKTGEEDEKDYATRAKQNANESTSESTNKNTN